MRRLVLVTGTVLVTLAGLGCGSTQRATDADWSPEPQPKDKRQRETEALNAPPQVEPLSTRQVALLGVRHDLMLANGPHEARCSCLAVEVGAANDANKFFWTGSVPDTGADALAIAVGARGVACPGGDPDDRRRRPSISAVDAEGEDIVIEIENLPEGRPLASGAIIPKPGPRGAIFVRPRRGNTLYGLSPGAIRCKVR
jgi:hypothetical protein